MLLCRLELALKVDAAPVHAEQYGPQRPTPLCLLFAMADHAMTTELDRRTRPFDVPYRLPHLSEVATRHPRIVWM